jgi:hypothetical protein
VPPTFLLVAFLILLGFAAPLVLAGVLFLITRPQSRVLGQRMLRWGGVAAFGTMAADAVLQVLLKDVPTPGGMLIGGGAAFTIACGIAVFRRADHAQPSA